MNARALALLASILLWSSSLAACGDDDKGTADTRDTAQETTADTTPTDTRGDAGDTRDTSSTPCDPVLQSGCEAGENCTYVAAETFASCVPAGPVPANTACSTTDRCQRGVCMSVNQTGDRCYQVCAADTDCGAGTANKCLTLTGAAFKVCKIPGVYTECNLLTQDCAAAGRACYAVADEAEPICLTEGTAAPGAECASAGACIKGHACVNDVCRAICDPDNATSCGATATCRDLFDDAGYCAPN